MKRLLTIIVLCLAASGYCSAALVQSITGGSATATVGASGTLSSSASGFANPTVPGNLIVCVVWSFISGGTAANGYNVPTVSGGYGGTFDSPDAFEGSAIWTDPTGTIGTGQGIVFTISNAPSMPTSSLVTAFITNPFGVSKSMEVEFDLYEFSLVVDPPVLDIDAGASNSFNVPPSGTPDTGTISPSSAFTGLILALYVGQPGINIAASSGYTLGINSTLAGTIGQMEYRVAAPGITDVSFSGTSPNWGIWVVSLKTTASPGGGSVPRHRGQVF